MAWRWGKDVNGFLLSPTAAVMTSLLPGLSHDGRFAFCHSCGGCPSAFFVATGWVSALRAIPRPVSCPSSASCVEGSASELANNGLGCGGPMV